MTKVIEFYVPKNFRKPLRMAAQPQLGKIIEVLSADEEISLTVRKAVEV
jgi:hypothetical protein